MNKAGEAFENAILHWRDAQGIGTALIPAPLNDKVMILGVLQRIYARSPTCKTLIITNNFQERQDIIEFLTHQEDEDNNKELLSSLGAYFILERDSILKYLSNSTSFNNELNALYERLLSLSPAKTAYFSASGSIVFIKIFIYSFRGCGFVPRI